MQINISMQGEIPLEGPAHRRIYESAVNSQLQESVLPSSIYQKIIGDLNPCTSVLVTITDLNTTSLKFFAGRQPLEHKSCPSFPAPNTPKATINVQQALQNSNQTYNFCNSLFERKHQSNSSPLYASLGLFSMHAVLRKITMTDAVSQIHS